MPARAGENSRRTPLRRDEASRTSARSQPSRTAKRACRALNLSRGETRRSPRPAQARTQRPTGRTRPTHRARLPRPRRESEAARQTRSPTPPSGHGAAEDRGRAGDHDLDRKLTPERRAGSLPDETSAAQTRSAANGGGEGAKPLPDRAGPGRPDACGVDQGVQRRPREGSSRDSAETQSGSASATGASRARTAQSRRALKSFSRSFLTAVRWHRTRPTDLDRGDGGQVSAYVQEDGFVGSRASGSAPGRLKRPPSLVGRKDSGRVDAPDRGR